MAADALLAVLAEAERGFDADVERRLLAELAAAELLVPVAAGPGGAGAKVTGAFDQGGHPLLLAFTGEDAFDNWAARAAEPPSAYTTMTGRELAALAPGADAVALFINPAGPHGGRLERRFVDVVAAGGALAFDGRDDGDGDLALRTTGGALALRPFAQAPDPHLVEALGATVDKLDEIEEAWLVEMTDPGPPHPLLVLVGPDTLPPALRDVLHQLLTPERFVDALPLAPADWHDAGYDAVRTAGVRLK
jgi:hypothetical protein